MRTVKTVRGSLAAIGVAAVVSMLPAADWPQFRGPQRDGASAETGLSHSWPEGGPKVLWRKPLGQGYSAISVVDGRLYTMFGSGKDELVGCFDAATGKEFWRFRADDKWKDRWGDGPRSTPTVHDGRVYALSAKGKLHALDSATGRPLWSVDLQKRFGAEPPHWGASTSPLVEGKLLLVNAGGESGGSVIAFDRTSGKVVWQSQGDKAGYSAPVAITVGGRRQVLVFTGVALVSLAPADGSLLWRHPWKTSYDVNAATPIFIAPDKVFVSSGYDKGAALLRVSSTGKGASAELLWDSREMKNKFSSSVLHEGHLYGFDEKTLKCLDAGTGEVKWQERGLGHGSLIYADGHLMVLGDRGTLVLVQATAEGYRERGRMQVFDSKTWTMPTLVDGKLYLRDEAEIVSIDVSD